MGFSSIISTFRPSPPPSNLDDGAEQYRVNTRPEILAILRALVTDKVMVTVYFVGREQMLKSRILAVNPQFEELIIDCGLNGRANNEMVQSAEISIEAYHHQIKIIFDVEHVQLTIFDSSPAFRMRLPNTLLRLQRRNDYRARSPVLSSATISISDGKIGTRQSIRIADISCGGIAFVLNGTEQSLPTGLKLANCKLDMPKIGALDVTLEVRHTAIYKDGLGRPMQRVGCRFLQMSGASATLVQRYINLIDVERRRATFGT